jgi:hypothetical protein
MPDSLSGRMEESVAVSEARSPSGKAKVCKTFIGGSIPPRASKAALFQAGSKSFNFHGREQGHHAEMAAAGL